MKNVKIVAVILFCLFKAQFGFAQAFICKTMPSVSGTTPVAYRDSTHSMIKDINGNIIMIGTTTNAVSKKDFIVSKFSPTCSLIWTAKWDTLNNNDEPFDVTTDNLGNIYVTGYAEDASQVARMALVKFNTNGSRVWSTFYTRPAPFNKSEWAFSVVANKNGGDYVYMTGYTVTSLTQTDATTLAYNASNGTFGWQSFISAPNVYNINYSMCLDTQNGLYITGEKITGFTSECYIRRLNKANGAVDGSWYTGFITSSGVTRPNRIICNSTNVFVGGTFANGAPVSNDMFVATISITGVPTLFMYSFDKLNNHYEDQLSDIYINPFSGNVYVTGSSSPAGSPVSSKDVTTIALTPVLGPLWVSYFAGAGANMDAGIEIDGDCQGSIYVGGKTYSSVGGNLKYLVVKYNGSTGAQLWATSWSDGATTSNFNDIVVLDGRVFLGGTSGNGIKFEFPSFNGVPQSIDCNGARLSGITEQVESSTTSIYPNPSTGIFHLTSDQSGTAKVYDLQGKLFKSFEVHENENDFDLSMFENGIYFLVLTDANGEGISKQRIVINK